MINRITYPDSGVKLKKLNQSECMTYGELLEILESMNEEQLDMEVIIYDEEGNMFWSCDDFLQAEEDFEHDLDIIESGQPFFVVPR
jgi:hypothetical protein